MNVYLDYAETQITAPDKRRMRHAKRRAQCAREKQLRERDELFALRRKHHRARRGALLAGPHGAAAQALIDFMEVMSLEDGALINLVVTTFPRSALLPPPLASTSAGLRPSVKTPTVSSSSCSSRAAD
jgi:hypothetical protein